MNYKEFKEECAKEVELQSADREFKEQSKRWINKAQSLKYSYHFEWLGRPIIQYPQDIVAMQELIWTVQPDLIIETGIAHGGSLIFSASMLELNAACGGPKNAEVLGVDIDIRVHNREAIETHPMSKRITMIQGSSIAPEIVEQIKAKATCKHRILVCLDSNHTHEHVLAELEAYAPLTSIGSYCVVFDTVIEDMPDEMSTDRPWGKGDNPKSAVSEYMRRLVQEGRTASDGGSLAFEVDKGIERKLLITVAPGGYLKRII